MITIYTSPTCGKCKALKSYMVKHNLEYTEIDVTQDYKAHAKIVAANKMELPAIEKDDVFLDGNYAELIQQLG